MRIRKLESEEAGKMCERRGVKEREERRRERSDCLRRERRTSSNRIMRDHRKCVNSRKNSEVKELQRDESEKWVVHGGRGESYATVLS